MNLKKKLPRPKLPRSSLTRLLRSSRDSTLRGINFISNGRKLSKTLERETSSSMRLVRTMPEPRTIWIKRRQILMIIRLSFRESRITTLFLMEILLPKKEF
jgi:hypothetical protein